MGTLKSEAERYPELVIGLVAPVGTDLEAMEGGLQASLSRVGYGSAFIRLSALLRDIPARPWCELREDAPEDERLKTHMEAGNILRSRFRRNDALALLAIGAIRAFREQTTGNPSRVSPRRAYVLRSLKRPEEALLLRRVYGPRFILIAAYSAREARVSNLSRVIAHSHSQSDSVPFRSRAEELIHRDEAEEGTEFGQNVRDTFPLADAIFDPSDRSKLDTALDRFVDLLFGHPFHTPTLDEQGMFLAYAASLRSASLNRQVGAVICRRDGTVVSVGVNEVPKPGGGLYWAGDAPDLRDHVLRREMGEQMRHTLVQDILRKLADAHWLAESLRGRPLDALAREALQGNSAPLANSELTKVVEFYRAVHAEMAALMDAARYGLATQDCVLYTTTYPCHDCAKHLLAAGVGRVVYTEPYPKSLATEMFPEAIEADASADGNKLRIERFVGIAPRRYIDFFCVASGKRKGPGGMPASWNPSEASPQLPEHLPPTSVVLQAEEEEFVSFMREMERNGLARKERLDGTNT